MGESCRSLPVLRKRQRGVLRLRQLFERIRDGDSILGGKGTENEGGLHAGGGGLPGASPSEALSIRLLMGWRMCLEVSMTTLLNARDIPRQQPSGVCVICLGAYADPLRPTW